MQLADEIVEYQFEGAVVGSLESWSPLAELQSKHLISRARFQALMPTLNTLRSQLAAEREMREARPDAGPIHAGFVDLPLNLLQDYRRRAEASELGRILAVAQRFREEVDRVVVIGSGPAAMAGQALAEALLPAMHNDLPAKARVGKPRINFEFQGFDNDRFQDLLDMLENTCVDPDLREERWGVIAVDPTGQVTETAVAFRLLRAEAARFYGPHSPRRRKLLVPVTRANTPMHELCKADQYGDDDMVTLPENLGQRFMAFTAAGLLPAAAVGLDVRALLLGAATMTKRFLEEPFDRNPVMQMAAVGFLASEEHAKAARVLAAWSSRLEALGRWQASILAETLGKNGRGVLPVVQVMPRDLQACGQLYQDGPRTALTSHLVTHNDRSSPIAVGMADRNEDNLNGLARKSLGDLKSAAWQAAVHAHRDAARPTTNLILPTLSEHTLGQTMQMLMLAAVMEARLMGLHPYGGAGTSAYQHHLRAHLANSQ